MSEIAFLDFTRIIHKEEEGLYIALPFHVPDNIAAIEIAYNYERFEGNLPDYVIEKNIIDLALNDAADTTVGARGSEISHAFISAWESTAGFKKISISSGTWRLILGAYKIQEAGCPVHVQIKLIHKAPTLLKGDFHVHSCHSDGVNTPSTLLENAKQQGLDFICITDHNTVTAHEEAHTDKELTIIRGMELTQYNGHCTFLGIGEPSVNLMVNGAKEVREILKKAKADGVLLSLAHPFCENCGWHFGFDVPHHFLEIWNGKFAKKDYAVLAYWQKQLALGKRIPVIGGSDFHEYSAQSCLARPTTFVYSLSRAPKDILKAISEGHCFVAECPSSPTLSMSAGEYQMGDVIPQGESKIISISLAGAKPNDRLRLICETGILDELIIRNDQNFSLLRDIAGLIFCRVELFREDKPILIGNPIYFTGNGV